MRHIYKGGRGSNGLFMEYSVKLKPEVNILELGEKCSDVCTFTKKRHIRQVQEIIEFMCDRCEYTTKRRESLKRHKDTKHYSIYFMCHQC